MNKILIIVVVLIAAVGIFAFLGNKKTAPATTQPITQTASPTTAQTTNSSPIVTLSSSGFEPKEITVKAGTTVVWENKSGAAATVSSDNHPAHLLYPFLNLGEFADGASVQVAFEKAGKYSYHNHFNASERGFVMVE
ncbi:MAG: hypothetical protein HW400_308 [Candidatus Levybacteria bacterium]|nr:hypothetical protein [Candidatus Levybacteria bacterium]